MSLDYMTLAWRTELSAGPRLVLLALCDNANDSGSCHPSIQTLADKCGLSVRSVRSHVADMEKLGLLNRNERAGRSTYYQIDLKALRAAVFKCLSARAELSEFDRGILRSCAPDELFMAAATPANSAAHPGKICRPPRQILPPPRQILPGTPANSAAITNIEPLLNHQGNQNTKAQAPDVSDVPADVLADFTALRKAKRAPMSQTALDGLRREGAKVGMSLAQVMAVCCERGWASFKADWVAGNAQAAAGAAETPYQRSMRERMQEAVPAIARKAPGAPQVQAVDFFQTVEAAPELRRIGGAA